MTRATCSLSMRGRRARLAQEPRDGLGRLERRGQHELDRDRWSSSRCVAATTTPIPPIAEDALDPVLAAHDISRKDRHVIGGLTLYVSGECFHDT